MIDPETMSERNAHAHLERILPHQGDRQRIAALLERGWSLSPRGDHPLGRLQGRAVGPARLLGRRVLKRLESAGGSQKA
jgi:hypothetical protein